MLGYMGALDRKDEQPLEPGRGNGPLTSKAFCTAHMCVGTPWPYNRAFRAVHREG